MPFLLVRNDITRMKVDAIVNAANHTLLGGGGVDGCIHRAAGPGLLAECRTLGGCETGQAKITKAYNLPAQFVIHTVGPIWQGGARGEREMLASCYRNSLALAEAHGCSTVAFPLISAGVYGYPKDQALQVASAAIRAFLQTHDMTVYLVIYHTESFQPRGRLLSGLAACIEKRHRRTPAAPRPVLSQRSGTCTVDAAVTMAAPAAVRPTAKKQSLADALKQLDESFSEMLLRKIDEQGMTDAQCYKKANVDRKLFSKIRNDKHYKPSKSTVLAFAVALEMPLPEAREMLQKAGFALSHASKFDIIVEYFLENGIYDVHEINEALFAFDQSLLGSMTL